MCGVFWSGIPNFLEPDPNFGIPSMSQTKAPEALETAIDTPINTQRENVRDGRNIHPYEWTDWARYTNTYCMTAVATGRWNRSGVDINFRVISFMVLVRI